jgi:hypothetical protein
MRRELLPLLLCLGACSDNSIKGSFEPGADTAAGTDPADTDTGADTEDTGAPIDPVWYTVRADLAVIDGVASGEGAVLAIDVVDADLERTDCVVTLDTSGVVAGEATDDGVAAWWATPVTPVATPCARLPSTLVLGVGPLLPDIRARLGAVGQDDIADSLYGAYVQNGAGETTFGYAATDLDLTGDDLAAIPLPDGLYHLAPLYLLALSDG